MHFRATFLRASSFSAVLALTLVPGCPTPTPTDAGGDAGSCVPGPTEFETPGLFIGTPAMPEAMVADYTCLGTRTVPTAGADITYPLELRGFGSGDAVGMARVWFFRDNVVTDTCGANCQEVMTDAMGNTSVTGPANAWYAYRVFERAGPTMATRFVDSAQINEPAPGSAGTSVEANAVAVSTLNLIPAVYGLMRVPGTAIVAGQVQDCMGRRVRGGVVRLFRADGCEIVPGEAVTDPHIQYFDGMENPDNSTTYSQVDGLYASANIPAPATGFEEIRAEAWGRRTAGGALERIGCEVIGVYENGVSIVNLGPLRSDYPAGHACAD